MVFSDNDKKRIESIQSEQKEKAVRTVMDQGAEQNRRGGQWIRRNSISLFVNERCDIIGILGF